MSANSTSSTVSLLLGNGNGTFQANTLYQAGSGLRSLQAGDFNGDGVLDLVSTRYLSNQLSVLIGSSQDGTAPLLNFDLKTLSGARQALPIFDQKIQQLAKQRGQIGAFQSRVQVGINNLQTASENYAAAESRIRDADIADESSKLLRLNILQQAASSVLSQANQQPELALRLLSS